MRSTWEGNYQLYVDNFRSTSPHSGNTTIYGICVREIINFILIFSGQLALLQILQLYAEHVRGKLSTLCWYFPASLPSFRYYNCMRNTWEGNYQLYVDIFRPTCPPSDTTTVCGTREREIINFMLIFSGQLALLQIPQVCMEYVRGKLSTLYWHFLANLSIFSILKVLQKQILLSY